LLLLANGMEKHKRKEFTLERERSEPASVGGMAGVYATKHKGLLGFAAQLTRCW
jgi:hypothetical protein